MGRWTPCSGGGTASWTGTLNALLLLENCTLAAIEASTSARSSSAMSCAFLGIKTSGSYLKPSKCLQCTRYQALSEQSVKDLWKVSGASEQSVDGHWKVIGQSSDSQWTVIAFFFSLGRKDLPWAEGFATVPPKEAMALLSFNNAWID